MAIDTENKRRSVQNYGLGGLGPVPDGTIGAADRATVSWLYAGLAYITPEPIIALAARFHRRFHLHHNIPHFS